MAKIRVMIVEDSAFMRKALKDIIEASGKIEVVEMAKNGKEALEKIEKTDIDVVTMDVEMPEMDGLTATKEIMRRNPTPIVMLSSVTHEGSVAAIKAIEYGAVDIIVKPSGSISLDIERVKEEIWEKIETASISRVAKMKNLSAAKVADMMKERIASQERQKEYIPKEILKPDKPAKKTKPEVILIGCSTGGPQALMNVIPRVKSWGVPIVVIQHMPKGFTRSLAQSLDGKSSLQVKEAEFGEVLLPDIVYVAPGGEDHLVVEVKNGKSIFAKKSNKDEKKFYIPSVDVAMKSVVSIYKDKVLGVIMTGMGNDGLEGFRAAKEYDNFVVAESEATAVVYGMPRVVVEAKLADEVVPMQNIADVINKRMDLFFRQ